MPRHLALLTTLLVVALLTVSLQADDADKTPPPSQPTAETAQAWTLEEAVRQAHLNPDDVYLQYVALQLARSQNKADDIARSIEELQSRRGGDPGRPNRRADALDLFTGALAVQECLQLDTMRGQLTNASNDMASPDRNTIKIADLAGPTVESHPWAEMLDKQEAAGKTPEIGPLDLCVPADQHYFVFQSLPKLLDAIDLGNVWGAHLFSQAAQYAKTERTSDRLKAQLAIQVDPCLRPLYEMVVAEVAVTGSDLYFREGSDVTMLFRLKQPKMFKIRTDCFLKAALKSRPDAVRSEGRIGDVDYVSVTTADRAIHVFAATPRPDLHVRSNSKAALERVLATVVGDPKVARLGDSTEFKYIRTLMPRGAKEEDGLIYFSDPFIRRLVGPELKLTERRRMICYNHLRMIGHAAMLHRTQFGKTAQSLDELVAANCAPAALACPCGGTYSLAADGMTGACSHHGNVLELVPCREIPLEQVTEPEATEYRQFVTDYSQYWRRFFDPIAIRVQMTPNQYRAETIILPLIDNSVYTGMAMALGGEPEPLDALPVPKKNIFSMAVRLNKEELLKHGQPFYGMFHGLYRVDKSERPDAVSLEEFLTKGIGNQIGMHVYDATPMFDFNLTGFLGDMLGSFRGGSGRIGNDMLPISFLIASLNSPVYLAIPVTDAQIVDKFLDNLDNALVMLSRQGDRSRGWFGLDYDFYRLASEEKNDRTRCYGVRLGPVKWRLFFARIDNGLYIASKSFILDDLAASVSPPPSGEEPNKTSPCPLAGEGPNKISPLPLGEGPGVRAEGDSSDCPTAQPAECQPVAPPDLGPTAHAMLRIRPDHWNEALPGFQLGWAESSRRACLNNLSSLSSVARVLSASTKNPAEPVDVVRQSATLYGAQAFCPDGGRYEVSPDGREVHCTVHGTAARPRQLLAPSPGSPMGQILRDFDGLTAELTFLEDGLHAVVTIKRK